MTRRRYISPAEKARAAGARAARAGKPPDANPYRRKAWAADLARCWADGWASVFTKVTSDAD